MEKATSNNTKHMIALIVAAVLLFATTMLVFPTFADGAVYVGDEAIEGYEPTDIVNTDVSINVDNPGQAANSLENTVVKFIRVIMPFLMIACVCLIVYNAIRNLVYFNKKEKQISMGDLIKNMFVQFFFILFAFIIVEVIVFVVTGGQSLLFATLLS